jgi:hypothetical protein
MKTRNFLFGIIVFAVAVELAAGLVGCHKSDGLVGTWRGESSDGDVIAMTFTKDTISAINDDGETETINYKIKDDVLVMWQDDEEDSQLSLYKINGNKLSLINPEEEDEFIELERVKPNRDDRNSIRSFTIQNSTGIDGYYLYIRQAGNSNEWSEDLFDDDVPLIDNSDIAEVPLKNPLNGGKRYDLRLIGEDNNDIYTKRSIKIVPDRIIEFTKKDLD